MTSADEIKQAVRERYAEIVLQPSNAGCCSPTATADTSCCGGDGCGPSDTPGSLASSYANLPGYVPEADYGLGCGLPTEIARLAPGQTVLDLGSGAGNDAFVARAIVGEAGHVIGVDMTEAMIAKARANAEKRGFTNVEFRLGEIEALPVEADTVDVVVSNCVLNLVPDKRQAFAEIFRVLRPGGHFSISDIVSEGEVPADIRASLAAYAACIGGAVDKADYLGLITATGFTNVRIAREHVAGSLNTPDGSAVRARLLSITVYADKPA
ncbi:MAG: arsenite methyltransferase [Anaerolineales bacterium]|nr:arsenite methyltransferase [Anaerolineales bacterium]